MKTAFAAVGAVVLVVGVGASPPDSARSPASSSRFAFHSSPWVNLHHFLYHEARNTVLKDQRLSGRVRTYLQDREVARGLNEQESATFEQALRIYAIYGELSLLDEKMLEIGNTVVAGPDAFPGGNDAEPAFAAMRSVMPIYLRHWWPRHDASNRARIEELLQRLSGVEDALAKRLEAAYESSWPEERVRVDVTVYSGRHGAYATGDPNHIVLASGPDWFPGDQAIDVLFHEVGHTQPFENAVVSRSNAAARAAGVNEGRVWHSFLFYVPSRAAEEVMPAGHVPYAFAEGGPLVDGRMAAHLPFIERGLAEGASLAEVFAVIHQARAAAEDRP